jgi:hypothetical protein
LRQQFVNQAGVALPGNQESGHVAAKQAHLKSTAPGEISQSGVRAKTPWIATDVMGDAGAYSPARTLQQGLSDRFAVPERRWSKRATLLFILTFCGGFWAAVAMAASVVLR